MGGGGRKRRAIDESVTKVTRCIPKRACEARKKGQKRAKKRWRKRGDFQDDPGRACTRASLRAAIKMQNVYGSPFPPTRTGGLEILEGRVRALI